MEDMRNACRISVEKPEGKRRLGRPRRRWEVTSEWSLGKYGGRM
jgi:hypothetical protein